MDAAAAAKGLGRSIHPQDGLTIDVGGFHRDDGTALLGLLLGGAQGLHDVAAYRPHPLAVHEAEPARCGNGGQDAHDEDDHQQFYQGEPGGWFGFRRD